MTDYNNIEQFYDGFSETQQETGVSKRNFRIHQLMIENGFKKDARVLEIGCGVGTQTRLIASYLKLGSIFACDISSYNIEKAKINLASFRNVKFSQVNIVTDDLPENCKYDVIVLADVIEHIPLADHLLVFEKLQSALNINGVVFINIPNPYYLEKLISEKHAGLQAVDQPIYTSELAENIKQVGLYISFLKTYEVWYSSGDYQFIVLKRLSDCSYSFISSKLTLSQRISSFTMRFRFSK